MVYMTKCNAIFIGGIAMNKRSVRVFALSACMILGLSLAGCGNSETKM